MQRSVQFGHTTRLDFAILSPVRNSPTLSPCHLVTLSPCHLVTLSPCHLVTLSPCHLVTLSPCHLVTLSPCHLVTLSRTRSAACGRDRDRFRTVYHDRGDRAEHELGKDEPGPIHAFLQDRVDNSHEAVADARPEQGQHHAAPRQRPRHVRQPGQEHTVQGAESERQ